MRALVIALAAIPTIASAEPHATGAWLEIGLDSQLLLSANDGPMVIDLPVQHLVVGAQMERTAFGVEGGLVHFPGGITRLEVGPALRQQLVARGATELVADAAVLANIGLSGSQDGGPTLYTLEAGLEARHWLDRHLAVGGGVLVHGTSASQGMTSQLDLGITGTLHAGGVF
jgi:hypothetical protein